jgi:GT2 family glycosyltransferase
MTDGLAQAEKGILPGTKVGVAIVNWNSQAMLDKALAALAAQTLPPHRVVVIDNASEHFQCAPVAPLCTRYERLDRNTGFARGNNLAIELLRDCDWIALVNPDAFVAPDWIEQMLDAAAAASEFAFFGSKTLVAANPTFLDGAGDIYHVSGLVWRRGYLVRDDPRLNRAEVFGPCAAAAMYARHALEEVGGFDEDFFCYVEDVDLAFRLRLAGYRCLFVPEAIAYHVGSGTTGGRHSEFSVYHGHRNLVWAYVKNMPGWWFWLFLPLHVLMNLAVCIFYVFKGQSKTIFRAKRDALRGLPKMWNKRALVQRQRMVKPAELIGVMSKAWLPTSRHRIGPTSK